MRACKGRGWMVLAAAVAVWPGTVRAQPVETLGTRALGMGGAFVAVADDPSAVYWNPAGLAAAGFFGLAVDLQWTELPRSDATDAGATRGPSRGSARLVAVGTPPLGLAYYRLRQAGQDRRDSRPIPPLPGTAPIARLDAQHVGVSLLQSLGDALTVGATLKYVHATAAEGIAVAATPAALRDAAADLDGRAGDAFDMDLGARVAAGRLSLGLVVRNLLEPSFATGAGGRVGLDRQVRAGVAIRVSADWTAAADLDLTVTRALDGESRRLAAGVERWLAGRRVAVRGGARFNTVGDADPVGTLGATVALRSGIYAEGQLTAGASTAALAWGGALRVAF